MNNNKLNTQNIFTDFPDVVSVKHLQQMLGIGRSLAYEMLATKKIVSIKSGSKILIPKQSVIDFLSKGGITDER